MEERKKIEEKTKKENKEKENIKSSAEEHIQTHSDARQKGFFEIIKKPLLLWLGFYIIFLIGGLIDLPQLSAMFLYGNYVMFLALLFGLWLGRNASRISKYFSVALTSSFTASFIIGIIGFAFIAGLNAYSSSFAAAVFGAPAALSITLLLQYFASSWIEMILTTMLAAAVGFEFSKIE